MGAGRRKFTREFKEAAVGRLGLGVSVGRQALEIDFLRRCLQHVEEQRKLQALDTRSLSTRTSKRK
jgi:hypothetical protein